jgi:hypothetical protein
MKKLFGRAAGGSTASSRKDGAGPLTNKTVQVGPHTVLVEHVLGLGGYGEIYRVREPGGRRAVSMCRAARSRNSPNNTPCQPAGR